MAFNLGIDLGGTKILAVLLDEKFQIVSKAKMKVKKGVSPQKTALSMKELSSECISKANAKWDDLQHIGISIPSSVDPVTGEAFHSPALGWKNIPIRKIMNETFQKNVVIENDVNCGIIAEHKMGAAQGFSNVIAYFVGTGLGGGIIINNNLYKGTRGLAGELGHETVKFNGRKCGCGKRGCIEAYCSKTAFAKRFAKIATKNKKIKKKLYEYFGDDFSSIGSSQLITAWNDGNKV
ncbi:MAG TPA: ROK family protein, partial [Victivallales bacterium]|nr:ROK family protein [Victivallales bacterium]